MHAADSVQGCVVTPTPWLVKLCRFMRVFILLWPARRPVCRVVMTVPKFRLLFSPPVFMWWPQHLFLPEENCVRLMCSKLSASTFLARMPFKVHVQVRGRTRYDNTLMKITKSTRRSQPGSRPSNGEILSLISGRCKSDQPHCKCMS